MNVNGVCINSFCVCKECEYYKGCHGINPCNHKECRYYKVCTNYELRLPYISKSINEKGKIIKVKYLKDIKKITQLEKGDWIDLRVGEDIELKANTFAMIPLGVAIELPKGFEALLLPRSSTFNKYGIIQTNSIGVIDESYCGNNDEWKMPVFTTRDVVIPKNTRIAQFRIIEHQPKIYLLEATELSGKDRGGFGSTGEV